MKNLKPTIPKPKINMPKKPSFGMVKFPHIKGMMNPLKFNK